MNHMPILNAFFVDNGPQFTDSDEVASLSRRTKNDAHFLLQLFDSVFHKSDEYNEKVYQRDYRRVDHIREVSSLRHCHLANFQKQKSRFSVHYVAKPM